MKYPVREYGQELAKAALVFGAGVLWVAWMLTLGQWMVSLFQ